MKSVRDLDARVASAFYGNFSSLRPAQNAIVEPLLAGNDVVLSAGTGSGKTEAVVAPLVSGLWQSMRRSDAVSILYIAPTKALLNDLERRLHPPMQALDLRIGIRHGDRDDLVAGLKPHLLLTTPESLDVLLLREDPCTKDVAAVVVDEAHLLYNTQRGLQLSVGLRRLAQASQRRLQISMLSATVGRLSDMGAFLLGASAQTTCLEFPPERTIDAQIRHISSEIALHALVERLVADVPRKLLMFVDSRRECERLVGALSGDGDLRDRVFAHYSSLSATVRAQTEKRFATLRTAVCVATSTLELGIDIGDIDAVLLWGVPPSVESFLQRIGRGNRRSSKTNVVCLIPDTSQNVLTDALRFAVLWEAARAGELPIRKPYELYGAFAQQSLGIVASKGDGFKRVADLCKVGEHLSYLNREVVEEILGQLQSHDYLVPHGYKNRYGPGQALYKLLDYRLIYGNFALGSQTVAVWHGAKTLGEVPAANLLRIRKGSSVRFAGRHWRVDHVSGDGIRVAPASRGSRETVDFMYTGGRKGWDPFLSNRLWDWIHREEFPEMLFRHDLRSPLIQLKDAVVRHWPYDSIPYVREPDGIRYFTFGGYLVNKAVGLISGKPKFEALDLTLKTPSLIDWSTIPSSPQGFEVVFDRLFEVTSRQSLYQALLPAELQQREFLQDWLKDEAVPLVLERLRTSRAVETTLVL